MVELNLYCTLSTVYCRSLLMGVVCFSGWVIIDRSGKHFGSILNFIRDEVIPLPDTKAECTEILAEAK